MTTPAGDHASHDPLLIAAHLDGSLDAREVIRVHDWLSGCAACVTLRVDLAALASATRAMATPARSRDFTLTVADAERARGHGWRRALAMIASQRDSLSRPLALGLTTLGLAGLVVANIPSASFFGGATSAGAGPVPEVGMSAASEAPLYGQAPIEGAVPSGNGGVAAQVSPDRDTTVSGVGDGGQGSVKQAVDDRLIRADASNGPSVLIAISLAMLVTGLALALLRWSARRLGDG